MDPILHASAAVLLLLALPGPGDPLRTAVAAAVDAGEAGLIELRRDLHRHPELAGQEERTAGIVAGRLEAAGLEVRTGVGGHGVVAVLHGGRPGPVVAYRADMDAMASEVPDPGPFPSETPGVRHICGHDVHTTIAVGIAEAFAAVREDIPGTVVFLFQPAEETAEGAAALIEDGALDDPAPEAIFAVHCAPLPVGQIASGEGILLAGVDLVRVALSGDGDPAGAAEASARVITAAAGTGEGEGFTEAGVLGSEASEGGWTVTGMVRASTGERRAVARESIRAGLSALELDGVTLDLAYEEHAIPPVDNDPELIRRSGETLRSVLGDSAVVLVDEPTPSFSEDFSRFQERIPGALWFLGVSNPERGIMGLPHHPRFAADEKAIGIGAKAMAAVLLDVLESE